MEKEGYVSIQAVNDVFDAYKYLDGNDAIYRFKQWMDGQEPVRPMQKWVPVTERLPEKGKVVLVWYEYFRYGNYNRMYQTYGIGYQYNGLWGGDVSGESARCIAWMELPEPYNGGDAE